jgi:hypothetical protein
MFIICVFNCPHRSPWDKPKPTTFLTFTRINHKDYDHVQNAEGFFVDITFSDRQSYNVVSEIF